MFKKSSLLSAAFICLAITNAEAKTGFGSSEKRISKPKTLEENIAYGKKLIMAAKPTNGNALRSTAKTTVTKSRVIAYAYRDLSTMILSDTARLYYGSPNRGSDMLNKIIQFDSLVGYSYDFSSSALAKDNYIEQTFDANNNILSATEKYWDGSLMVYENSYRTTNTYNAFNNVLSSISETWDGSAWVNDSKTITKYDAAQNKLVDSSFSWDGTAWEATTAMAYTYSATNKLISTTYNYYDATFVTWFTVASSTNTYDAADYMIATLFKTLSSVTFALEDYSRTTYTNDATGNPLTTFVENWNDAIGKWEKISNTYNTYDASKNKLSELLAYWNSGDGKFDTSSLITNTYNSYNQVNTEVNSNWDMASSIWEKVDSTIYYYEEHTPTAIVELVKNSALKVYPIPANNELSIELSVEKPQNVGLVLFDIQGEKVLETARTFNNQSTQKISVNHLPSATYFLQMNGAEGLKEVRQITIAH